MKVKDLREAINGIPDSWDFQVSCDEELNTLFNEWEVSVRGDKENTLIIFGLSGSEEEMEPTGYDPDGTIDNGGLDVAPEEEDSECPECGHINTIGETCKNCGHTWRPK
jgi:hypothetical protein